MSAAHRWWAVLPQLPVDTWRALYARCLHRSLPTGLGRCVGCRWGVFDYHLERGVGE